MLWFAEMDQAKPWSRRLAQWPRSGVAGCGKP